MRDSFTLPTSRAVAATNVPSGAPDGDASASTGA
jgi:hypothetical protein